MDSIISDLRYALRSLRHTPGFAAAAALALALGIGGSTAVFSVLDAVVLRPLPLPQPEQLVRFSELAPKEGDFPWSPGDYLFLAKEQTVFSNLAVYGRRPRNLMSDEGPENVAAAVITSSFFPTIGVPVQLGRNFEEAEDRDGAPKAVILGEEYWRKRFDADRKIIGKTLTIDGEPTTVVGVARGGLPIPGDADVWMPIGWNAERRDDHGNHGLWGVARLKAGVTVERADQELKRITGLLAEQFPRTNKGWSGSAQDLRASMSKDLRSTLLVLLGAVGLVLLIACANVAGMLLARGASRQRELSIRAALGSSRLRILRQLLTESVLLSVAGGLLGVLFAAWGVDALLAAAPQGLPRLHEVKLDGRVLAFSLAVSLAAGILAGIAPALHGSRVELHDALKEGALSSTGGASRARARSLLVIGEISLALVLLLGAGLLLRSFHQATEEKVGFEPRGVFTARLSLTSESYRKDPNVRAFVANLLERVRGLPGVQSAAITSLLPMDGVNWITTVKLEGDPPPEPGDAKIIAPSFVSADFFETLKIKVLSGRALSSQDADGAPLAVVVNQAFVKRWLQGRDPVGVRLRYDDDQNKEPLRTIVGVVEDVRVESFDREAMPQVYLPVAQLPVRILAVAVRTGGDPMALQPSVAAQLRAVDPQMPLAKPRALETVMQTSIAARRFQMILLGFFAAIALVLAAIGIYAVMVYNVAQRTREIGVRMALGAPRALVLRMVVGQGMKLALAGVGVGLIGALAASRALASSLYGISPTDPITYVAVAALLSLVAAAAAFLPARRATRVDPALALRAE